MKAGLVGDDAGDPAGIYGQRAIAGTPESGRSMQTMPLPTRSPMTSGAKSPRRRRSGRNSQHHSGIAIGDGTSRATDTGFAWRAVLGASAKMRHCTDAKHSVARHPNPLRDTTRLTLATKKHVLSWGVKFTYRYK